MACSRVKFTLLYLLCPRKKCYSPIWLEGVGDLNRFEADNLLMLVTHEYTLVPKPSGNSCLNWLGYTCIKWNKISIITDSRQIVVTAIWQSWGFHYTDVETPFSGIWPLHCESHYPDIELKRLRKTTKPQVVPALVQHISYSFVTTKGESVAVNSEM